MATLRKKRKKHTVARFSLIGERVLREGVYMQKKDMKIPNIGSYVH
jgi:hypothetical protein